LLYLFEDYTLDTDRRELRRGRGLVPTEPQVFDVLAYLIANRDRVVSKDDLLTAIWDGRIVSESALTTRINAVRCAVGDSGEEQRLIKTVPHKGIRFVGSVREGQDHTRAVAPESAAERVAFALPDRPSIAVLPFTNMSGDPAQDYFADGMAEEIIAALSRCKWLFVIARNSSFTYRGKCVDVRQIGRDLGVRYVLEGSVRRAGNRLRFIAQLIETTSGAHIWADRFDGEMTDVFDLQDRITENVVATLEPKILLAEIERLKNKPAANLDAYDLLLRAQELEYEFTRESLAAALGCLQHALELDPSYARALALMAYCRAERFFQGWAEDAQAEITEAAHLGDRAVELGKDDGNVLWMSSFAMRHVPHNAQRAKELAHRSLLLNPNSASALANAGWGEALVAANPGKALELFHRAERLNPRDPRGWFQAGGMSLAYFLNGQFEEAAVLATRALVDNPRYAIGYRVAAASLARRGRSREAAHLASELLKIEPDFTITKLRARLMYMHEGAWEKYAEGLRLAGLPG
jgi:TolB-like protein